MKSIKSKLKKVLVFALAVSVASTSFLVADTSAHAQEAMAEPVVELPCHHGGGSCVDWFATDLTDTFDETYQAALDKAYNEAITYSGMTDVQKARALHDYLAQHVEYDYTFSNYDGYGALVDGTAVCQGYAEAYADLLDMAGIENAFALSDEMLHIWNFVKLDGKWYHVDVTWDDPSVNANDGIKHDRAGEVYYDHFLVSDDAMEDLEHSGWVTSGASHTITCTSTDYESAWWRSGTSAIFCIDGKEYYLDQPYKQTDTKLMCRTGNSVQTLCTIDAYWDVWDEPGYYWPFNYSGLSYYNGKLYVNNTTKVYSITPGATTATTVYTYTGGEGYIYGSLVCDGKIRMSIWKSPNDGTEATIVNLPGVTVEAGTLSNVSYETTYTYSASAIPAPKVSDFATNAGLLNFTWYQNGEEIRVLPVEPGTYTLKVKAAATASVSAVEKEFTITIEKRPITVTAYSQTVMYGNKIDPTLVEITSGSLASGDEIDITIAADSTEPTNNGVIAITNVAITNRNGKDVTSSYDITKEAATLIIVPPHTHRLSDWMVVESATCTKEGTKTRNCVSCNYVEDGVIPKLGHSFTNYTSNGDATCQKDGTMTAKCDRCSATDTVVESNSIKDHNWGKGVVDKEQGIIEYTCQFGCGKTKVEPWVSDEVVRVFGSNRYKTSLAIADELKEELNVEQFETIIVASGLNFPDALAGSYLSAKTDAPILMVNADTVTLIQSYIEANLVDGGTVYLLGGTGAVPATIEENLKALRKYEVQRLSGKGRYDTNLAILNEAGVTDETILVCTGTNFADSLSGSATGLPILMVDPVTNKLTDKQIAFLENIDSDIKVIGGTGAVSDAYMEALEKFDKDNTVERIKGASRYNTSVEVAQEFFPAPHTVVIASATSFPDGLCGGPLAYAKGCPLILTGKTFEPASAFAAYNNISNGIALGGTGALSTDIVRIVFGMNKDKLIIEKKYK